MILYIQILYPRAPKIEYNFSFLTLKLGNHHHDYLLCRIRILKKSYSNTENSLQKHYFLMALSQYFIVFLIVFPQFKINKEDKPASKFQTSTASTLNTIFLRCCFPF